MSNSNVVSWFEIPVTDVGRAVHFYNAVFGVQLQESDFGPCRLAVFPSQPPAISGCLAKGEGYTPNSHGTIVYLNGGEDLSRPLGRVEAAGGTILTPKTPIGPEMGYFAHFQDTEGNRVGLFSKD